MTAPSDTPAAGSQQPGDHAPGAPSHASADTDTAESAGGAQATDAVEVRLDGFAHGGDAVGRLPDGKAVFVPRAIPGEVVRVRVVDDRRRWARAELVEVVQASPDRVDPPCPYVPDCGGCDLQHVTPSRQRELKRRVVTEQLRRIGHLDDPPVEATRPVGPDTGYRTRARFHAVGAGDGGAGQAAQDGFDSRLGFHAAATHDVVPVERCLVLHPDAQSVRDAVGDASGASEVTVRAQPETGTAAAILRPGPGPLDVPQGTFDIALEQPDGSTLTLRGEGVLAARVGGHTYRFDASCFFQVNPGGAEAVAAEVLQACGGVYRTVVWDLYAGVGLLSLPLAAGGAEVTAVEEHPPSAGWAGRNAADAGLDVAVVTADAEGFVADAAAGLATAGGGAADAAGDGAPPGAPGIVVLDPPRAGAGLDMVADLLRLAPARIVYVACDPAALARDAGALVDGGYDLVRVVPLDLFPHTHHIEAVAAFVR